MNILISWMLGGCLALGSAFAGAQAQSSSGAESRLKERNIVLPSETAPVANYVNAVRVGSLLFMAGNTPGPDWTPKGKVGRDLTVEQGYQAARQTGLIMLSKCAQRLAASIA
jgi:hypothetical protein